MPSPFPGVDPYLEGSLWTSVHFSLSAEIARQLAPKVRPRYLVLTAERFVIAMSEGVTVTRADTYPDAGVAHTKLERPLSDGDSATIAPAPLRLATVIPSAVPHVTIEIRDAANRRLVAAIEVLSPTNKRGSGREEYLVKRRRILLSAAHLMEIDLLRTGERVPMQEPLPDDVPYFVFLSRAENRPLMDVWPIALDEPLPIVPVPLLPDDADVSLDLQQAFSTVYDDLGFDLAVDYAQPPEVPLQGEAAHITEELLQDAR